MFEIYHEFSKAMDETYHSITFKQLHELLGLKESVGTNYLIREVDARAGHFHFGQYIEMIFRFCSMDEMEYLQVIFDFFDHDREQVIPFDEFRPFVLSMETSGGKTAGLEFAMSSLVLDKMGKFSFKELVKMNRQFPTVLYPMYAIRVQLMRSSYGEGWWEQTHYRMNDDKKYAKMKEKADQKSLKDALKREQEAELIKRMGWLKFTFMPWERARVTAMIERAKMISMELEVAEEKEAQRAVAAARGQGDRNGYNKREGGNYRVQR